MTIGANLRRRDTPGSRNPSAYVEALEARRLLSASLLKDVNTGPIGSEPAEFVEFNGAVYFAAEGPQGRELYRSDGTPGSATLFADIEPGYVGSAPGSLTVVGDMLYFVAGSGGAGRELWKTDGTAAGTVRVKDIVPGPPGANPEQLEAAGGRLYFVVRDAQERESVWRSDGTEAGTLPVATPGNGEFEIVEYEFLGDALYFLTATSATGPRLWASDQGSLPRVVKELPHEPFRPPTQPRTLTALGDRLVFVSGDGAQYNWPALWTSDGTAAGTRMVPTDGRQFVRRTIAVVGGWAYFFSGVGGDEDLLRTDGEEVEFVANVRRGYGGGPPGPMAVRSDGTIFFEARDAEGTALWRSGGGEPTRPLKRVADSPFTLPPLTVSGDTVYFGSGGALWKSDGTEAGTVIVRQFVETYDGGPREIAPFRNGVVFLADDVPSPGVGYEQIGEPWFSDGTAAGTYSLGDVNPATLGSNSFYPPGPSHAVPVTINGRLLFAGKEADGKTGLWTTDGTTAGTTPVGGLEANTLFALVAVSDDLALVLAGDGARAGVWRTDGTAAGTRFVAPVWLPDACDCSRLDSVAVLDGELYFPGTPGSEEGYVGMELMKSDGTPEGTVVVKDVAPSNGEWNPSSDPVNLTTVGDYVYFTAMGGEMQVPGTPNELWRTDGTEAGTVMVRDFDGTFGSASARDLFNAGGTLYFRADAPVDQAWGDPSNEQLWKSDGTPAGTVMVKQFLRPTLQEWWGYYPGAARPGMAYLNGTVYFPASTGAAPDDVELWKSDGTPAGTVLVRDINPGAAASAPRTPVSSGGRVYFSAEEPSGGRELWSSDGTAAGTSRVADLNPGAASSDPVVWGEIDGRLYFTADDGTHGQELWSTDGTETGTTLVDDVRPGAERPFESAPQSPVGVSGPEGRKVVFWADDRLHGMEPWVAPATPGPDNSLVTGRYVFYNNSAFDGGDPAADARDDAAVATDKLALLPGQAASFANVTSYTGGINGVMVDVKGLHGEVSAGDFDFEVVSVEGVAARVVAPAPQSVTVRRGAGAGGSDRVTLIWVDDAVRNGWLRVTVKANADTGLAADDVFSFGSLVGDAGGAGSTLRVNALDLGAVKRALNTSSAIEGRYDFNRDGRVNALDLGAVKANLNRSLSLSTQIARAPVAAGLAGDAALVLSRVWDESPSGLLD